MNPVDLLALLGLSWLVFSLCSLSLTWIVLRQMELLMAKLADVQLALDGVKQSVVDLGSRIPAPQAPPAATEADLDGVVQQLVDVKASVDALVATV